MYKIQVSYHYEEFGDYPELPYNSKKLAEKSLKHHIEYSNKRYPKLEARFRMVEISREEGGKHFIEVVKWHKALD